jgi:hypothetical protein
MSVANADWLSYTGLERQICTKEEQRSVIRIFVSVQTSESGGTEAVQDVSCQSGRKVYEWPEGFEVGQMNVVDTRCC